MGQSFDHLNSRKKDQLISALVPLDFKTEVDLLIITNEDDEGVALNGGRIGARFAAKAIINVLMKMISPCPEMKLKILELKSHAPQLAQRQNEYKEQIETALKNHPSKTVLHLGGGHDHVYPLLKAVSKDKTLVINIDPHLDTRTDDLAHSGTPFRQMANEAEIEILQWGIHEFANAPSNHESFKKGSMTIVSSDTIKRDTEASHNIMMHKLAEHNGTSVLSLDADAIHASVMTAVSAVNHDGLDPDVVTRAFYDYKQACRSRKIVGIYEYNPIYDDLSQKGSRFLAHLIYSLIN